MLRDLLRARLDKDVQKTIRAADLSEGVAFVALSAAREYEYGWLGLHHPRRRPNQAARLQVWRGGPELTRR